MCTDPSLIGEYRLIPLPIKAIQYTGPNIGEVIAFIHSYPAGGKNIATKIEVFIETTTIRLTPPTGNQLDIKVGTFLYYYEELYTGLYFSSEADFFKKFAPVEKEPEPGTQVEMWTDPTTS